MAHDRWSTGGGGGRGLPGIPNANATFPYKLAGGTYANLFDTTAAAFVPDGIRLVRFYVTNPSTVPVALTLPTFGASSWVAQETWTGGIGEVVGTGIERGADCGDLIPRAPDTLTRSEASASLSFVAYYQDGAGNDTVRAAQAAGGQVVVPAASGGTAGLVALYLVRPENAGTRSVDALAWNSATGTFRVPVSRTYRFTATRRYCCDRDGQNRCIWYCCDGDLTTYATYRELTAGLDVLSGAFSVSTRGFSGGTAIGRRARSARSV